VQGEWVVIYCRTNVRSAQAVEQLLLACFEHAGSFRDGINACVREIEPGKWVD
jgi:rhodanese-related sulfurtransferase